MKEKTIKISTKLEEIDNVRQKSMTQAHFDWLYQRLFGKFLESLEDDFGFKPSINFDIKNGEMFIEIKQTTK